MKYFEASFATVVIRFYVMMAIALIAGFASFPWLGILCVPLFLSAMMGIEFDFRGTKKNMTSTKIVASRPTLIEISEAA